MVLWRVTGLVRFLLCLTVRTSFVPEHARVAPFVAAGVDQLPFLALIERHLTARTEGASGFVFQYLTNRCQI